MPSRCLIAQIVPPTPSPPAVSRYSSGARSLVAQLLKKDPHARPSTGAVLRKALIKDKIGRFLSEAQVLHWYTAVFRVCVPYIPHSSDGSFLLAATHVSALQVYCALNVCW